MSKASDFRAIAEEIEPHHLGARTESAALLAWFLIAAWRIEPEDVEQAICDGRGDKGVDALTVDTDSSEITIFQSKHRQSAGAGQGDNDLKKLVGVAPYFESTEAFDTLLASGPNNELLQLLARQEVRQRIEDGARARRLVVVTNGILDPAGEGYLQTAKATRIPLEVWDAPRLASIASRTRRPDLLPGEVSFRTTEKPLMTDLAKDVRLALMLVSSDQLVNLPGIADLSIFARNVRLSEGRTRINRELARTVGQPDEHPVFPAYHNGLTLLTHELSSTSRSVTLKGIAVVNGCQSLLTLHQHREEVGPDLKVLVKVVQVDRHSPLADRITYRTNNQNPIDIRDQRSSDVIQRDLRQQMHELYGDKLAYIIREGEDVGTQVALDNRTAAQLLMAVYEEEPWNAVRKVRLFDQDYRRIFNRNVDAHKLYFLHKLSAVIDAARKDLRPDLSASFATIRVTLAHLLAQVLRLSERGRALLEHPERWLPEKASAVLKALTPLAADIVESVNFHVQQEIRDDETFDPKVVFKSQGGIEELEHDVLRQSRRQAEREDDYLFSVAPQGTGSKPKARARIRPKTLSRSTRGRAKQVGRAKRRK